MSGETPEVEAKPKPKCRNCGLDLDLAPHRASWSDSIHDAPFDINKGCFTALNAEVKRLRDEIDYLKDFVDA